MGRCPFRRVWLFPTIILLLLVSYSLLQFLTRSICQRCEIHRVLYLSFSQPTYTINCGCWSLNCEFVEELSMSFRTLLRTSNAFIRIVAPSYSDTKTISFTSSSSFKACKVHLRLRAISIRRKLVSISSSVIRPVKLRNTTS